MRNPLTHIEFTLESVQQYVDAFVELKDGWDSYHADAITPEAIAAAKVLLHVVKEVPQPIPTNNGGIALCWLWNGHEVNIEIGPDGKLIRDEVQ